VARLDHRDYAAAFPWITVHGGEVTLVVSGRHNFPLDHRGCAVMLTWITAAAPQCSRGSWRLRRKLHVDHSG
jgi:hypothetical protein